jgi:isocitrate dehydrogenase
MKILYTLTDEAPALATRSLLPIIEAFADATGVQVEVRDISLAGRILAQFPDHIEVRRRVPDDLAELSELTGSPEANIIKLPNVSASVPQLRHAVAELQAQGYALPDYPEEPRGAAQRDARERYDRIKGSAVNPVLRQGNSDRRAPASVKRYARMHPHSMGPWSPDSRSHVATMSDGDFRSTERSTTLAGGSTLRIEHRARDGAVTVLGQAVPVQAGEVIDAAVMHVAALDKFLAAQIDDARARGVLYSIHLKATMMKVSDPIIFGHAVRTYFPEVFERYGSILREAEYDPAEGLAALQPALAHLSAEQREAIEIAVEERLLEGPPLAMVDSDRGITNLHVPSDVIIDASMPAAIRTSGCMWNAHGELQDTKFVIPDHSYAPLYAETIEHCKRHGAFDPATMGSTANVGLMAQQAEEYGSHDKTFKLDAAGVVSVVDETGATLLQHEVEPGDIWRMCQTKDEPIRDWVALAVSRARATGTPAVFWLDEGRPHDRELLRKVLPALDELDTDGLEIIILPIADAARFTLDRARAGKDTISVTGNVLRDYLTDLFPILELGTSAKMLSVVPLMAGGGLFETGAGGSAPKHVQQFLKENHLRWDSLGEFLALAASLELLAQHTGNPGARLLGGALDRATGLVLEHDRSPRRRAGELDNRGSHFYLAMYWARELAGEEDHPELAERFAPLAARLADAERRIVEELAAVQGAPVDIGGYYRPDPGLVSAAMRPSITFNETLSSL